MRDEVLVPLIIGGAAIGMLAIAISAVWFHAYIDIWKLQRTLEVLNEAGVNPELLKEIVNQLTETIREAH